MERARARSSRRLARALVAGVALLLTAGVAAGANLLVEIEGDPAQISGLTAASLAERAGGADLAIVDRSGRRVVVRTTEAGYDALLADGDLATVRLISGEPEAAAVPAAGHSYSIRLTTGSGEGVEATPATMTSSRAALVETRRIAAVATGGAGRLGPGTLLVRGLAADGSTLSERVVADPRLVRFEAVGSNGAFTGRREFLRADALLQVDLPDDPRLIRLAILAPPTPGRGAARPVATVDLP